MFEQAFKNIDAMLRKEAGCTQGCVKPPNPDVGQWSYYGH